MHESLRRVRLVLRGSDDPDRFVECTENLLEAAQDVNALLKLSQLEFKAARDDVQPKRQELTQNGPEIDARRRTDVRPRVRK